MLPKRKHSLQSHNINDAILMNIRQYVFNLTQKSSNLPIFRKKRLHL